MAVARVCVCVPVTVTGGSPLNHNSQSLQSTETKLLHEWPNAAPNATFTQPQQRLQQSILGAQTITTALGGRTGAHFRMFTVTFLLTECPTNLEEPVEVGGVHSLLSNSANST